ncbi:hypothetical protein Taro_031633 [Colocasia esculenta]|uniref:Uncharacterized protein n=1 Tax=Colocasia esculenta TaxID=4460 RepID=A0A843VX64_COLES|nr:hypothetical protein [Colocasia esculenta]
MVTTQCGVAFLTVKSFYRTPAEQSSHELFLARGLYWRISGRLDLLELGSTCSRHEDVVWSGGNVVWTPYFACFTKGFGGDLDEGFRITVCACEGDKPRRRDSVTTV